MLFGTAEASLKGSPATGAGLSALTTTLCIKCGNEYSAVPLANSAILAFFLPTTYMMATGAIEVSISSFLGS